MKFADRVSQLTPSATLAITSKAKAMKKSGIDVVGFGAGEPDFDTPRSIKDAAIEAIHKGITKYTPASGTPELKQAICDKLKKNNGLGYRTDEVVVSCGAKHALYNIFQVLCDKGDEVIIISPYWLSYPEMVRLSGATPKFVSSDEKRSFVVDPKLVKKSITRKTKAVIINSPSNPTGAVFPEETLREIAGIACEKDIFVISDEIYEIIIYGGGKHASIGALGEDIFGRTLTVNGVSKTYSMTGWRIGYVAGPVEIRRIGSERIEQSSRVREKRAIE